LRAERVRGIADRLGTLQSKAIDKLTELLDSERESVCLSAIRVTLENAVTHHELAFFDARLADLEERAKLTGGA
jgi:hypothetical protein